MIEAGTGSTSVMLFIEDGWAADVYANLMYFVIEGSHPTLVEPANIRFVFCFVDLHMDFGGLGTGDLGDGSFNFLFSDQYCEISHFTGAAHRTGEWTWNCSGSVLSPSFTSFCLSTLTRYALKSPDCKIRKFVQQIHGFFTVMTHERGFSGLLDFQAIIPCRLTAQSPKISVRTSSDYSAFT